MHNRHLLSILIPCFLVILLAGCADNPADNTTPADTVAPFEASSIPAEGKTYTFTGDASVGFVGSKVTGSHTGGFKEVSGSVIVPEDNLAHAQIDVTIDMNSLWSDSEKLTGHLKTADFFDVGTYPQATFTSTSIAAINTGFEVKGNLTLHGVTKGITFPATIALSEDKVMLITSAEFSINRMDFGVAYAGKADDLIRPEVVLSFNLNAAALP